MSELGRIAAPHTQLFNLRKPLECLVYGALGRFLGDAIATPV
jgi:hypothetical protein